MQHLSFALLVATLSFHDTASAASIHVRQTTTSSCGVKGYNKNTSAYSYTQSATLANFAGCNAKCNGDAKCVSFAYGSNACLLYTKNIATNVNVDASSPYTFFNRGCAAPGISSTTTTTRALTTTAKSTSVSTTTTSPRSTSTTLKTSTTLTSTTRSSTSLSSTTSSASTSTRSTSMTTSTRTTTASTSTSAYCSSPTPVKNNGKRGLAYNDAPLTLPFSLCDVKSKVSWSYNWYSTVYSANTPNYGYNPALAYIPMLWSSASDLTDVWQSNVAKSISTYGADAVLAFNEPDGCGGGGSCMNLTSAVEGYQRWVSPLRSTFPSLKLGAPAVTNGNIPSMGLSYLSDFLSSCKGCNIDFIPIHWYGDAGDITGFKNYVTSAYTRLGSKYPLWITEFGTTSGSSDQVEAFLKNVLPWLDGLTYVHRYAWFWDAKGFLIDASTGGLSRTGVIYNTI